MSVNLATTEVITQLSRKPRRIVYLHTARGGKAARAMSCRIECPGHCACASKKK